MLERVLEPEWMDDPDEALCYDEMDHDEVNRQFVRDLLAAGLPGPDVLDVGIGTARIPVELCQQHTDCRVMGADAALAMLEVARINVATAGFEHRIELCHCNCRQMPMADAMFDVVMSNSLLHHLPDPEAAVAEMLRVLRPGGRIFVRDLVRPADQDTVEQLVQRYTGAEPPAAQQLFRQSLLAALTVAEIRDIVTGFGFSPAGVSVTSDRHWTWSSLVPPSS
ncbi:MAG: hypothetical protein KatS3mg111_4363 [Pirellulaceae bacterium]|nr:MAG: hypothetical protein KatS3mg111_4363 [Pirellulaceae bacterium]